MLYIYCDRDEFLNVAKQMLFDLNKETLNSSSETLNSSSETQNVTITDVVHENGYFDLYIMFGIHDYPSNLPQPINYIVVQLEQSTYNLYFSERYINYMKGALEVWEYSLINYRYLQSIGIKAEYTPILYGETYKFPNTFVWNNPNKQIKNKNIDVLFCGKMNERRNNIIQMLRQQNVSVVVIDNVWGAERDTYYAKSKIILNIHYYDTAILETVRLSYLLSNGCCIVSEHSADPILDKYHENFVYFTSIDNMAETCLSILNRNENETDNDKNKLDKYYSNPQTWGKQFNIKYSYLTEMKPKPKGEMKIEKPKLETTFSAVTTEINDGSLIMKLKKIPEEELPMVSIVTITYNRKSIFPNAIKNFLLTNYPSDKLEWIIVDDSPSQRLTELLHSETGNDDRIKYHHLKTTGRLSIGQKRNYGVKVAQSDYIVFMDDDDYYYPYSVYSRIATLLNYPQYDLVGVTKLDIYDIVNNFSARVGKATYVSEASMGFRKSFWIDRKFPEEFCQQGEGYSFIKGREHKVITMPSCFNLIAITHKSNYTEDSRSYDKFKDEDGIKKSKDEKHNILSTIDLNSRLFLEDLWERI